VVALKIGKDYFISGTGPTGYPFGIKKVTFLPNTI
jgi:hypothetical protein